MTGGEGYHGGGLFGPDAQHIYVPGLAPRFSKGQLPLCGGECVTALPCAYGWWAAGWNKRERETNRGKQKRNRQMSTSALMLASAAGEKERTRHRDRYRDRERKKLRDTEE